jgi:hypothetical protein
MVRLSPQVLPLLMLHAGCDTLLTHRRILMQLWCLHRQTEGHLCVPCGTHSVLALFSCLALALHHISRVTLWLTTVSATHACAQFAACAPLF